MLKVILFLAYLAVALSAPRVIPLFHGHHFDDLMNDCLHDCPPVLLGFYSAQCVDEFKSLRFSVRAPSRGDLFMGTYNESSLQDVWFKPTEPTDLTTRFQGDLSRSCPQLVFAPYREWTRKSVFIPAPGTDWRAWLRSQMTQLNTKSAQLSEAKRDHNSWELSSKDQDTSFRWSSIMRQAPELPAYTSTGYKLVKMPENVRALVTDFYNEHKKEHHNEGFRSGYTAINYWEVPTTMVDLFRAPAVRERIAELLRPIVEDWVGQRLVMTNMYGIREYHRGSWLKPHTDHVKTHVFSLILNVAQEGMDQGQDWPLEVIGFDGVRVNISMGVGDMVLYESAKLVHGRPYRLPGDMYVNCFAHYKPVDDRAWDFFHANDVVQSKSKGEIVDLKLYGDL